MPLPVATTPRSPTTSGGEERPFAEEADHDAAPNTSVTTGSTTTGDGDAESGARVAAVFGAHAVSASPIVRVTPTFLILVPRMLLPSVWVLQ